uniref:Uncharacterized protein n=1 Tax=Cannabis sativa TaxID=3483 RepID=A0A803PRU9_CANSA
MKKGTTSSSSLPFQKLWKSFYKKLHPDFFATLHAIFIFDILLASFVKFAFRTQELRKITTSSVTSSIVEPFIAPKLDFTQPLFLPGVTITFEQGDLEFEIMTSKPHKSKTPYDPNITFEVELIESKVRAIGDYIGSILKTYGIEYKRNSWIRSVAASEFSCYPLERLTLEASEGTSGEATISRRPTATPEMVERCRLLLGLPYGLRSVEFLLNEVNLRSVDLLTKKEFTCDYKYSKYSSWQQVLISNDEETQDYVARVHNLQSTVPWEAEEGASSGRA